MKTIQILTFHDFAVLTACQPEKGRYANSLAFNSLKFRTLATYLCLHSFTLTANHNLDMYYRINLRLMAQPKLCVLTL